MAISQEQLARIINHNSSTLCSPKGDKKLNEYKSAMDIDALNSDMISDEWDNFSLSEPMDPKPQRNLNQPISQNAVNNSRMPDAIKQSMLENQIDITALGSGGDTSFLDNLAEQQKQQKQRYFNREKLNEIQEQSQQYQPQYVPQPVAIDYNYLKHIVSECISEYFSKQPINESTTLKQIGLSEGKIRLVDNKGNVYGAELEYKGNVNDKKKTK